MTQAAAAVALLILASAGLSEPPPQTGNPAAAREGWREAASFLLDHVEPGDFIVMTRLPFGPPDGDNIGYYLRTLDDRRRKFRIVNPAMLGSEGLTWLAAYGRVWCVIASRPFYEARPELLRQIDSGFTKECSFAGGALFPEIAIYRSGK